MKRVLQATSIGASIGILLLSSVSVGTALYGIACTPAEIAVVKDAADLAHDICTLEGLTDAECIAKVLTARKLAGAKMARMPAALDAGDASDAPQE